MQDLRRVPFFIAVFLAVLIVSLETGGRLVKSFTASSDTVTQSLDNLCRDLDVSLADCMKTRELRSEVSGLGIPYLALIDGVLLFFVVFMTLALLIPEALTGRIQGIVTMLFALFILIVAVRMITVAIGKLYLMLGLLLSSPFGTMAYFAIYAFFPRTSMLALLSTIMVLKICVVVGLGLSQQFFFKNKALLLLLFTSFVASIVVSFLLGLVPGFLVSITDAVAAIVVGIIAAVWLVVLAIFSIPAIIKAVIS